MAAGQVAFFTVSPVEANDPEMNDLCLWIDYYVDEALDESRGGYLGCELPPFAEHFHDLWTYYGEWCNGAHAQYHSNIYDPASWARASMLLAHIGLSKYRELLDDFIAISSAEEERIIALYEAGDEPSVREIFYPLDDRFRDIERRCGALNIHLHNWLLQQPWVRINPDLPALTYALLMQHLPPHPDRDQRRAATIRRRKAETHGGMMAFLHRLRDRLNRKEKP